MTTTATLSLGTREDAKYWSKECNSQLGFKNTVNVAKPDPSLSEIKTFFKSSDNWLFIAGHFTASDHLYNEGGSIKIKFKSDRVIVTAEGKDTELLKGTDFKQNGTPKTIFWGGCDVHSHAGIVSTMRSLFDNPLMIGWHGTTGWEILYAVMGGYQNDNPEKDFFDRVKSDSSSEANIRKAWLNAAAATNWGAAPTPPPYRERFSVIGTDGTEHKLPPSSVPTV